jgi:hypothetical protein
MENLTPKQLEESLSKIVEKELYLSTMIWGAP